MGILTKISWTPGIGDPTFTGWLTVTLYFMTAYWSYRVFSQSHVLFTRDAKRLQVLWAFIALALLFLGFNKQLDLQTLFTDVGRIIAREQGWYQDRRALQRAFVTSIVALALVAMLFITYYYRRNIKLNFMALSGIFILITFVVIRATSFHHMDSFINYRLGVQRMNWILEIFGILMIAINAYLLCNRRHIDFDGEQAITN